MTTPDNLPHRITVQIGWGSRDPRSFVHFYIRRKPTIGEAVSILQRKHDPRANEGWFEPHNSGLVSIEPIAWEVF